MDDFINENTKLISNGKTFELHKFDYNADSTVNILFKYKDIEIEVRAEYVCISTPRTADERKELD